MSRMYGFGKIARLVAAAGILLLFTSYGNKKVHPGLNGYMLDKFMTRCKNQGFAGSRFEHYGFYFKEWGKIRGTAITKNGLFSPGDVAAAGVVGDIGAIVDKNVVSAVYSDEGTMEMTPREWITDGGFAADVPEVPASLRHFYDPTRPAGSRYLTDITNARIMGAIQKYALTNPRMDGLDWALGKPGDKANSAQDHQYTWEKGKNWIRMALQEPDKDKRNELMAAAWRSLGETLHMIADHGCPPHVRDDAHPSPLWGNNNLFGNPDPYEEYMDIIRNKEPQLFSTFANGQANQGLAAKISSAKTARDVAHALAEFTNAGFVTNETIAGTDQYGNNRIPVTHPGYTYPAPLLEQMSYNASDYTYYSASGVKQCTDHYYFAKMIPRYVPPFVDYNCVVSQAGVLVPNLIEAGSHVIKLYIPQLAIQWQREANGRIRGEVVHTTDAEYTNAIAYTGPVLIEVKNAQGKVLQEKTVEANEGLFDLKLSLSAGESARARIEFGGVVVYAADELSGSGKASVTGLYEGTFTISINKEAWIRAEYEKQVARINAEETDPQARENKIRNADGWSRSFVEAAATNLMGVYNQSQGNRARFEIQKTAGNESYYYTSGLPYIVNSLGHTSFLPATLTPLKNGENAGTSLKANSNGFTVVTEYNEKVYRLQATFKGNTLSGNWTTSLGNEVIYTASFSARKIREMD